MQMQSTQEKCTQNYAYKYLIKGSGTSYCLLNNSNNDEQEFVQFSLKKQLQDECIKNGKIKQISMGGLYLIILLQNGSTYKLGQIEDNNKLSIIKKPCSIFPKIQLRPKVIKISTGWNHTILQSQYNQLFGLGSNKHMQLGINNKQKRYFTQPVKIQQNKYVSNFTNFICGFRQSYFYHKNHGFFGCGQSKKYQLGFKSNKPSAIQQINSQSFKTPIKKLVCSKRSLFVLLENGQLYAFGSNDFNIFDQQNGLFIKPNTQSFDKLSLINEKVSNIDCGWNHAIIVKDKLQSYGRNNFGQLGRPDQAQNPLVHIASDFQIKQDFYLKVGTQFNFVINDSKLYGWGWNQHKNIINQQVQFIKKAVNISLDNKNLITQQKFNANRVWTYPAITIVQLKSVLSSLK